MAKHCQLLCHRHGPPGVCRPHLLQGKAPQIKLHYIECIQFMWQSIVNYFATVTALLVYAAPIYSSRLDGRWHCQSLTGINLHYQAVQTKAAGLALLCCCCKSSRILDIDFFHPSLRGSQGYLTSRCCTKVAATMLNLCIDILPCRPPQCVAPKAS